MSKEKLAHSVRKDLRLRKQTGEALSEGNWMEELRFYLQDEKNVTLDSLGEDGMKAVSTWFSIRSKRRAGVIGEDIFNKLKSDFGEDFKDIIENGVVKSAIIFITNKTEVTGLVKVTI